MWPRPPVTVGRPPAARREAQLPAESVLTQMSPRFPGGQLASPTANPPPAAGGGWLAAQARTPLTAQRDEPPATPRYAMPHAASCTAVEFGRSTSWKAGEAAVALVERNSPTS